VPVFSGGRHLGPSESGSPPTRSQSELHLVHSYAVSVTLSLATIGFVKLFRGHIRRTATLDQLGELLERASVRLTAALVGLLRSFGVHVFDADSPPGAALITMVNQADLPAREVVASLRDALGQTIAGLREIEIGSGRDPGLDGASRLFECGWSWGVVDGAPQVPTSEQIGQQPDGVAERTPYLSFTTVALDAIEGLLSERTRLLGLLNEEQQRLSRELQVRAELTRSYWATVATFGEGRWPVEDLPWRITEGESSDYFTLQVTSLAVMGLIDRRGADAELARIGRVLIELAGRARLTRRPLRDDPAISLHHPGVAVRLNGSEKLDGDRLTWTASEYAPLLLRRTVEVAGLLSDVRERDALQDTATMVWDHMLRRRQQTTALWDDPSAAFPGSGLPGHDTPSWDVTERVVVALISAAQVGENPLSRNPRLSAYAADLLSEADQLFDRELMHDRDRVQSLPAHLQAIDVSLRRAREILADRPGTAAVLAADVLDRLTNLAAGRADQKAPS
jgi:hypothetical protein